MLALAASMMFACQSEKKENVEETPNEEIELLAEETLVDETSQTTEETSQEEIYTVRGQLVSMTEADETGQVTVTLNHEAIPDVMMAMQMDFKADAAVVAELAAEDKGTFEITKTEEGFLIKSATKLPAETELTLKK